ncbi:MAG: DUF1722 domain-containing protein [Fibrobacter sp.]|nr:DUF1722 domain-containing protein [Fibrobacter sp.]
MKILVSSCLLGNCVRYDGGHKLNYFIKDKLGKHAKWVTVCPETESGMQTPREPMHLVNKGDTVRLVTLKTRRDLSDKMNIWINKFFSEFNTEDVCGFVFKSKSPSCGFKSVKIWSENNILYSGKCGLFASECITRYPHIPCIDEGRLNDPDLHDNFIEQVFVYKSWSLLNKTDLQSLEKFHTQNKYLIMAHNPEGFENLGSIISEKKLSTDQKYFRYQSLLMKTLRQIAAIRSRSKVLMLMVNDIKEHLSSDNLTELTEMIDNYRKGFISLRVPLSFLNHYSRVFKCAQFQEQTIFNPYPKELDSSCKT